MNIKVTKLTNVDLLRKMNTFTTGKESKQTLKSAYRYGHTTIRTQIFRVECFSIPQMVANHLRTHFTTIPSPPTDYGWMQSKRVDRGGGDFREVCLDLSERVLKLTDKDIQEREDLCAELKVLPDKYDRFAPTDFAFIISAEGLMSMAHKRLCIGAVSKETREAMKAICELIEEADPDLHPHLVRPCVATGVCREPNCCGYIGTQKYREQRHDYKDLFQ